GRAHAIHYVEMARTHVLVSARYAVARWPRFSIARGGHILQQLNRDSEPSSGRVREAQLPAQGYEETSGRAEANARDGRLVVEPSGSRDECLHSLPIH